MRLFLDPGVTTGWALFDSQGTAKGHGQITGLDRLSDFLTMTNRETPLATIFYEPFLIDNNKLFGNRKDGQRRSQLSHDEKKGIQDTLEVIGGVRVFGRITNIPTEPITDVTLKAALGHAGLTMPPPNRHHESHEIVALAYGRSWYIRNGIIKVRRRPIT